MNVIQIGWLIAVYFINSKKEKKLIMRIHYTVYNVVSYSFFILRRGQCIINTQLKEITVYVVF